MLVQLAMAECSSFSELELAICLYMVFLIKKNKQNKQKKPNRARLLVQSLVPSHTEYLSFLMQSTKKCSLEVCWINLESEWGRGWGGWGGRNHLRAAVQIGLSTCSFILFLKPFKKQVVPRNQIFAFFFFSWGTSWWNLKDLMYKCRILLQVHKLGPLAS